MASTTLDFRLPDTLSRWPWSRHLSGWYREVKGESSAWIDGYQPFDQKGLYGFVNCDYALLASLTLSPCNRDIVRLGSDMLNLWFIFSEYVGRADITEAQKLRGILLDALRDPTQPRPTGERCIGAMSRDFFSRATRVANGNKRCIERFLREASAYTAAIMEHLAFTSNVENQLRPPVLRNMEEYFRVKKPLCGIDLMFCLVEFGLDLPEEVLTHPTITSLANNAIEISMIVGDINSYGHARARGGVSEQYNIVTIIMNEYRLDLQRALDWLDIHIKKLTSIHLGKMAHIPSWNPRGVVSDAEDIDKRVAVYLNVCGQWVRGTDDWNFETERCFGEGSMEVKQSRRVQFQSQQPDFMPGRGLQSIGING